MVAPQTVHGGRYPDFSSSLLGQTVPTSYLRHEYSLKIYIALSPSLLRAPSVDTTSLSWADQR